MVDPDVVSLRLAELDRRIGLLHALRSDTELDAYLLDAHLQAAVERHLQIVIQCAIDVATHAVVQDTRFTPTDYADAFVKLGSGGLLAEELAQRLRLTAGLRNVLVHGYADVDSTIVWTSLERLDDLRDFAVAMRALL